MKIYKRIAILVLSLLLLIISFNLILNLWIGIKLDTLLNKDNSFQYSVSYKKVDISILNRSFFIKDVLVIPVKKDSQNNKKNGFYAKANSIKIAQIDIWNLLSSNKINAENIDITSPSISFYKNKIDKKDTEEASKPFKKILTIGTISVKNGSFKTVDTDTEKVSFEAFNVNLNVKKIALSEKTFASKIPFLFDDYSLECDSVYYHSDEFYDFKSKKIVASKKDFNLKNFMMIPLYNRKGFVKRIPHERDLYTISCPEIDVKNMKWGFKDSLFFFDTNSVLLDKASANIYRNKMPNDNVSKKKLYNKMLRDLKFNLNIDTLKIRNSLLVYEEEISFEKGSGKLFFDNFNLTATNIESGLGKNKLDDLNIKINCNFMKTSALNVDWSLNVLDKSDGFRIKGSILSFDVEKINPFSLPYMNVKVDGIFDKIVFDFKGNDVSSTGKLAMEYDDLKVTVFKNNKNERKKNKFLTAIGNLFVKKDSKDKLKNADVKVDRVQEKSFYNFLWLNIAEGLKKILI